jgi:putative transposase
MKTFCFKTYHSKKNRYLHNQISLAGEIYNHCIALHKRYYRMSKKSLNAYSLQKHLTKLKKRERYSHWNQLGSQAIQDINCLKITELKSQDIQGSIKTLTVKRDKLGDIYIHIVTDFVETRTAPRTGEIVGFDFGLKTFLTVSNGEDIESPLFFHQNSNAIRKANRNLSKKQRLSNNRCKARKNFERLHKRIANQRADFHWKLADRLTDKYDFMFFETLNIKAMQMLWGKKICDLGFYSFMLKLKYLASVKSKTVFCIGRFEPSSKTCSVCGYIYKDLELKEREWRCPECVTLHDRDRNASYNILRVGASTLGLGDVIPTVMLAISV